MRYLFGAYSLDTRQCQFLEAGHPVRLRPKVFHLLAYLLAHRDRMVSKQELCTAIWPHQHISDATFDSCMTEVRHAVGDSGRTQGIIQTRPGYGYRFVAPVTVGRHVWEPDEILPASPAGLPVVAGKRYPPGAEEILRDLPPDVLMVPEVSSKTLAEYKMVTVLVCTLDHAPLGGTRQDAERWHHKRQTVVARIQEHVARYQGTLHHVLEDSVLVFFGAPVAQEDHAQRAVRAALELRQHLPAEPPVRMALHTGPLVVSLLDGDHRLDYTAVGDTTTLAAHLLFLAPPGSVVLSEATQVHVARECDTRVLEGVPQPGTQIPCRVFEVLRMHERRTRWDVTAEHGVTPHVGRLRELALLDALFQHVKAGHGQVLCLTGEAGIGKSRHVFEFRRRLAAMGETVTWIEGQCLPFGQTMPLLPVIDQVRTALGITETDGTTAIRVKVRDGLRRLGSLEAHEPAICALLAVDPEDAVFGTLEPAVRRTRIFEALLALVRRCATHQPLVLGYEDLHWSDASTEAFLRALIETVVSLPILLVLTARVGYLPPVGSHSFITTLPLQRLSPAETLTMAGHLLGTTAVPAPLTDLLLAKADGVPLFVEELIKTLRQRGDEREEGAFSLPQDGAALCASAHLQGIIAARLDRLSAVGKRTVQLASVLGRQFPARLLARLVDAPALLEAVLAELRAQEILEQRAIEPEPLYRFAHAVLQEVTYASLAHPQRQAVHAAVGAALETFYAVRCSDHAAEIAHHYWEGAVWGKARDYAAIAGQHALAAYANAEARVHYARAVEAAQQVLDSEPRLLARLHARHGKALMILAAYPEAAAAYAHARAQMQHLGDRQGEIDILLDLSTVYMNTHAFGASPAREAIEQALALARPLADPARLADCLAHRVRVLTRGFGQLVEALPDAEEALHLAQTTTKPRRRAEALIALGRLRQWQGDFARAIPLLQEGATLAQDVHAGFLFGMAVFFLGNACTACGAYTEALQWYQQLRAYADAADDQYWRARLPNTLGGFLLELGDLATARQHLHAELPAPWAGTVWSEVQGHTLVQAGLVALGQGDHGEAAACLQRATALLEADIWMRWRWQIPLWAGWSALALTEGRYEAAWTAATQAAALAQRTDSRKHIARVHRLQGEILAAWGQHDAALQHVQASLRLAHQLRVPRDGWLGQATLGRMLARRGQDQAAAHAYGHAACLLDALVPQIPDAMRPTFLQRPQVQEVYAAAGSHRPRGCSCMRPEESGRVREA